MLSKKNRTMLLAVAGSMFILTMATGVGARMSGISGQSQIGCTCHGATPNPGVTVSITGIPANYIGGNTYPLVVTVTGGPATNNGGFDLSVTRGTLSTSDPNAQILNGEATHRSNAARSWSVDWNAPLAIAGPITFFVAGNAVNDDGTPSGDSWNTATFTTSPVMVNQPPTISLTAPDGNQDWTGGTLHTITWTMSDDVTPSMSLIVYLNYTSSSGSGAIVGPIVGATSYPWIVPVIDASDAKVNATVIDASGLKGFNEAFVPKIDSTAPLVQSSSPTGLAVALDAPINLRFSETMNKTSVETSFSLAPPVSNLVFTWSQTSVPDDTLSAAHDPFVMATPYTATLSAGAKDASDTGNLIASQYQWQFTTVVVNTPPSIVLSRPHGGFSYTGGSIHNIVWTASDMQDPAANLKIWVNYSLTGAAPFDRQILGLQGIAGFTTYAWTLPSINSAAVVLNATVVDTDGARGNGLSATFGIDSAPPVTGILTPSDMAVGIPINTNVQVSWSEQMNATSTEAAFSLKDTATWTPVAGVVSWAGNTMVFHPAASLSPTTQYQANVTAAASDASIPGNPLTAAIHWSFTTSSNADLTRPTISAITAVPSLQDSGHNVNVSALVQDDMSVGTVWLRVTLPGPPPAITNTSMTLDPVGGRYFLNETYSVLGTHSFIIWASDSSGNWNSSSGQFVISDLTPPAAPLNLVVELQDSNALKLTWTANAEPDLAGYRIYRSAQPGGPYTLLNTATLVTLTTYTDSGLEGGRTYYYVVTAVDTAGNESPRSNEVSGFLTPHSEPNRSDILLILILVAIVVVVVVLALTMLMRRKKARGSEPKSPPEEQMR